MEKKDLDLITVTSCSNAEYRDMRWERYAGDYNTNMLREGEKYIIHGQEIQTDKGDVNVLFAEREIPFKPSEKNPVVNDFYWITKAARDSGENVLIGLNEVSKFDGFEIDIWSKYQV